MNVSQCDLISHNQPYVQVSIFFPVSPRFKPTTGLRIWGLDDLILIGLGQLGKMHDILEEPQPKDQLLRYLIILFATRNGGEI
jgi:hypothetical protein